MWTEPSGEFDCKWSATASVAYYSGKTHNIIKRESLHFPPEVIQTRNPHSLREVCIAACTAMHLCVQLDMQIVQTNYSTKSAFAWELKTKPTAELSLTLNSPKMIGKTWHLLSEQNPSLFRYPKDLLNLQSQCCKLMSAVKIHVQQCELLNLRFSSGHTNDAQSRCTHLQAVVEWSLISADRQTGRQTDKQTDRDRQAPDRQRTDHCGAEWQIEHAVLCTNFITLPTAIDQILTLASFT